MGTVAGSPLPSSVHGVQAELEREVALCCCLGAPAAAGKEPVCGAGASPTACQPLLRTHGASFSLWPQCALVVLLGVESGIPA